MTNFMKRAADAVVDKLLELMQRDRAAQEAKPKSAEVRSSSFRFRNGARTLHLPSLRSFFSDSFVVRFGCRQ